jgi:outer membrane immunogenic protein
MRNLVLPLLASLAIASPALADTRAEVRGGLISVDGTGEPTWGAAAGIDFDLAPMTFAGVEVSSDKNNDGGSKTVWGLTGRAGVKLPVGPKIYVNGGYSTEQCNLCESQWHAGGGVQQSVFGPVYVKAEYRHYFPNDVVIGTDSVVAGVGVSF